MMLGYCQYSAVRRPTFALQTPVASDLRLLTVLLHVNLHLERIADQAVNMAKITCAADGLPRNPKVLGDLQEMGGLALGDGEHGDGRPGAPRPGAGAPAP
jgi:phosphate uptake regulator